MFKSGDKVFCCKQGNRAVYGNYYWVGKEWTADKAGG